MAYVDFSNAHIDVRGSLKPLHQKYLGLSNYNNAIQISSFLTLQAPWEYVATSVTVSILESTLTKYSLLFTGTFSLAGTSFGIYINKDSSSYEEFWAITNVSFSAGDTFSFIVDVEITGS